MGKLKIMQKLDKCSYCNKLADYLIIEEDYGIFRNKKLKWDLICNECRLKQVTLDKLDRLRETING